MIAKMSRSSKNIANSLAYVLNEKKGCEVVSSLLYDEKSSVGRNASAWDLLCQSRRNVKNKLQHFVISHTAEDSKRMTPAAEEKILSTFKRNLLKRGVDLDASPYILVAHRSQSEHLHYHLLRLAVGFDGKRVNDSMVGLKLKDCAILTSHQLGLGQPERTELKIKEVKKNVQASEQKLTKLDRRKAIDDANKRKAERIVFGTLSAESNFKEIKEQNQDVAKDQAREFLYAHSKDWINKDLQYKDFFYDDVKECKVARFSFAQDEEYVLLQSYVNDRYMMFYTNDREQEQMKAGIIEQRERMKREKQEKERHIRTRSRGRGL